jgi:ABC-2 type transport system permease protein
MTPILSQGAGGGAAAEAWGPRPAGFVHRGHLGLLWREARADQVRLLRTPGAVIPMLALPWAFYAFFVIALGTPASGQAAYTLATYGVFAALAPCLFTFGAGIAHDRESGILLLKQVSPLPGGTFLLARLATAALFTLIVLAGLYALAALAAGVRLPALAWAQMLAVHLAGVAPLCLLGLCVGLRVRASAAIAISNLLMLGLAVLSGLWVPLFLLPPLMRTLAQLLPTTHLAALALGAIGRDAGGPALSAAVHAAIVVAFSAAFGILAWRGWRRAWR